MEAVSAKELKPVCQKEGKAISAVKEHDWQRISDQFGINVETVSVASEGHLGREMNDQFDLSMEAVPAMKERLT